MKRITFFTGLLLLVFLASTTLALAKGPAAKILIWGPDLKEPVEISDQQALLQFSPLGEKYFDRQKGPLPAHPNTDRLYQVFLYEKDDNDQLQVAYAFQYAPGPPGIIYIPGRDEPWHNVNIGTISRGSTIEGHWFYASPEWDALWQEVVEGKMPSPTSPLNRLRSWVDTCRWGLRRDKG